MWPLKALPPALGSSPMNMRPSGDWVTENANEYWAALPSGTLRLGAHWRQHAQVGVERRARRQGARGAASTQGVDWHAGAVGHVHQDGDLALFGQDEVRRWIAGGGRLGARGQA